MTKKKHLRQRPAPPIWAAYRDIPDYPRKSLEELPTPSPGGMLIKPGVIPGAFGHKDVHIAWHNVVKNGVTIHLVTYTESAMTRPEINDLVEKALSRFRKWGGYDRD